MGDAIVVRGLSKRFYKRDPHRPTTFKGLLLQGLGQRRPAEQFWALRDINFTVAPGRMLGIVGANGAGKSTLLRLLGGVGRPDIGSVEVRGRIGALLELGAGFHPDLSGRDNVYVNGSIAGLTRRELTQRLDSIVNFAELEAFIDSPLRTYSTGMQMRLAFSIAAHTEPQVLLVDEFLSVGDVAFQRKCLQCIERFRAEGCAIVYISHAATQVQKLCDEAIWLRAGQIVAWGDAEVVAGQYLAQMTAETQRRTPLTEPHRLTASGAELHINHNRFGSLEVEIEDVRLLGSRSLVAGGAPLCIEIHYSADLPIEDPIFGVSISREDGFVCLDTNTKVAGVSLPTVQGRGKVALRLDRLDLSGGTYYIDVGIYESEWTYTYDYHYHVYPFTVDGNPEDKGLLCPPLSWDCAQHHYRG